MTVLRVQAIIARDNGIPADECINTWHFRTGSDAPALDVMAAAFDQLGIFYAAIDTFLAGYVATPINFFAYNLADPEPRVPMGTASLSIAPGSGAAFPAEVAICLSYRASLVSGSNPARRRGRIFLGPLDSDSGTTGTSDTRIDSGVRSAIATAAEALALRTGASDDARWVVFSPTSAGPPPWSEGVLEANSFDVTFGYIDDAYDTVRSRGALPSARTTWVAEEP